HPLTALSYRNVAYNLAAQGKYPEALASLERGTRSYEAARLGVAPRGLERAPYGAEGSPYAFLAAARNPAGRAAAAWAALEADLGRGVRDEAALQRDSRLKPAEQQRRDALIARRTALEATVLALVSRPTRTDAEAAELERRIKERQELERSLDDLAVAIG